MASLENRMYMRENNKLRDMVTPDGNFVSVRPTANGKYVSESGTIYDPKGMQDAGAFKANTKAVEDHVEAYYPKDKALQAAGKTAWRTINTGRVDPIGPEEYGVHLNNAVKQLKENGITEPSPQELKKAIQLQSVKISNDNSAINRVVSNGNLKINSSLDYQVALDNADHYVKTASKLGLDPSKFVKALESKYAEIAKDPAAVRELHNMTNTVSGKAQSPIYTLSTLTEEQINKLGSGKFSDKKITNQK